MNRKLLIFPQAKDRCEIDLIKSFAFYSNGSLFVVARLWPDNSVTRRKTNSITIIYLRFLAEFIFDKKLMSY